MKKEISRRKFLASGTVAVGACSLAAGMTAGSLIAPSKAEAAMDFALPLNLVIDQDKAREYGYCEYFYGGCGNGGGWGLVKAIQDALTAIGITSGSWFDLPHGFTGWGGGGGVSWGGTCGSLSGTLQVLNLAGKHGTCGNALVDWYTKANFPLANLEGYTPPADYSVAQIPIDDCEVLAHSVPEAMLCHNSSGRWLKAAGVTMLDGDDQGRNYKKDRCAKVTGDTCAKAAELLTIALAGGDMPAVVVSDEYAGCYDCHVVERHDVHAKSTCLPCHDGGEAALVKPGHWNPKPGKKK